MKLAPPDTLPDQAYVDELRAELAAAVVLDQESDGISVLASSLTPVEDGPWPELEIAWELTLPDDPRLAVAVTTGSFRLPFGRDWLELSRYEDPAAYAKVVVRRCSNAARHALRPRESQPPPPPPASREVVAKRWEDLKLEFGGGREVRQTGPGRVERTVRDLHGNPYTLTLVITPEEWSAILDDSPYLYGGFGELVGSCDDDEIFLIHDDGGLAHSIREEQPYVRGTALLRRVEAARARNPDVTFRFSHAPLPGR